MPLPWETATEERPAGALPWEREGPARPRFAFGPDVRGEVTQYDGRTYGTFEYVEPRGFWDWTQNAYQDIASFLSPRNWAMAGGALLGATAQGVLGVFDPETGERLREEAEARIRDVDSPQSLQDTFSYALIASPTFGEIGQELIRPYVSGVEEFTEYAYEHPVMLAIDASIVASGARAVSGAFRAGGRTLARGITPRPQFQMQPGVLLNEYGRPISPVVRTYMAAPAVQSGLVNEVRAGVQRTQPQRWVDATVDYWTGQGRGYSNRDLAKLKEAMDTVRPENITRFNSEFLALQQLPYDRVALGRSVAEGRVLPETVNVLEEWGRILGERQARWVEAGILTPERAASRARLPAEELRLASDIETRTLNSRGFREAMATWQADSETWAMTGALERPPRPVNPFAVRDDLVLAASQPELFIIDDAGKLVSPMYYPHQYAQDLSTSVIREMAEAGMQRSRISELKRATGAAFRGGIYNMDVYEVLRRNIRRTSQHEGLTQMLLTVVEETNAIERLGWKVGEAVPEGLRLIYPDGFKVLSTTQFDEQVIRLAREIGETGKLTSVEERVFANRMVSEVFGESTRAMRAGKPALIPIQVAEHIKTHMAPVVPWIDVLTNPAGATTFWRNFVLSFRPAWQVVNETTNAMLTMLKGNQRGFNMLRQLRARNVEMPGQISGATIIPEFGESFGYSAYTQQWLRNHSMPKLAEFNRWLSNTRISKTGRFGAEFNQLRDDFYKAVNMLGEMEREFRTAARAGEAIQTGGRLFNAGEVRQITRSGELMIDAIEHILGQSGKRGQVGFTQEMIARASEAVYSWSAMTPAQRKYLTRVIPFSGWQLFTNGLLFRLPVKYPGRAWLLKEAGIIGQNYIDDLFEEMGIDPNTVPEWDRTSIPLYVNEGGKVAVFRLNSFRLYDMLGTEDIASTVLSHPDIRAGLELFPGVTTFPKIGPLSRPPEEWGAPGPPRRNPLDIIAERLFGPTWGLVESIVAPYAQYGTGGVFKREPIIIEGERLEEGYDFRNRFMQYTLGLQFRDYDSYEMMDRDHGDFGDDTRGAFTALDNALLDDQGQDLADIRSSAELYLQRAYQYIDQIEAMLAKEPSERETDNLAREYRRYINQIERVESMLNYMITNQGDYVPAEMIHGDTWVAPDRNPEAEQ